MVMFFLILALVFVVLLVIITNIVIVPQSKVYVVERLGSYSDTWSAGLHIKIPFIERIAKKVSLKEQVADFPPQPVITRDNVTMQIDTVVFFQVMDAKLYTYGVNQPIAAIESPDQPRCHQRQDHRHPGRSHRQVGHQGEPRGGEEHHPAAGNSGSHGKADEG